MTTDGDVTGSHTIALSLSNTSTNATGPNLPLCAVLPFTHRSLFLDPEDTNVSFSASSARKARSRMTPGCYLSTQAAAAAMALTVGPDGPQCPWGDTGVEDAEVEVEIAFGEAG